LLTRARPKSEAERRRERGVLFGSGLVGGGGLTGVLLAFWVALRGGERIRGVQLDLPEIVTQLLSLAAVAAILGILAFVATRPEARRRP
jgi:hypothetical protein